MVVGVAVTTVRYLRPTHGEESLLLPVAIRSRQQEQEVDGTWGVGEGPVQNLGGRIGARTILCHEFTTSIITTRVFFLAHNRISCQ